MQLLLNGESRGIAMHMGDKNGYLEAIVREAEEMQPLGPEDPAFVALYREARARAGELGQKSGLPEEVVQQVLAGVADPGRFADLVAGYIDVAPLERQALLETLSVEERLRRVLVHIQRQIAVLDAQEDIKSQVQEELGERQREMFLREQLKQIRRELGEDDERGDLQELQESAARRARLLLRPGLRASLLRPGWSWGRSSPSSSSRSTTSSSSRSSSSWGSSGSTSRGGFGSSGRSSAS